MSHPLTPRRPRLPSAAGIADPSEASKRRQEHDRYRMGRAGRDVLRPIVSFRPRAFPIHDATWIEDGSATDNSQDTHLRGRTSTSNPNRRIVLKFPQALIIDSGSFFTGIAWDCLCTLRVQDWEQNVLDGFGGTIRGELHATLIYDWAGLDLSTITWANQGDLKTVASATLFWNGTWDGNSALHVQAGDGGTILRTMRSGFFFNMATNRRIEGILFQVLLFGSLHAASYFEVTFEADRSKGIFGVWNPKTQ